MTWSERLPLLLLPIVMGTLPPPPLGAGTFSAFGPEVFSRGDGSPVTVTRAFAVKNPGTTYVLRVVNGGLADDAYDRVSSTAIYVNGVQIIAPNDLNQGIVSVEKAVNLAETNQIAVQVRGKPGGALAVSVIGVDNDQPTISSTATPGPNDQGWNNVPVTVSFACADATSSVASCSGPITVSAEGANQVVSGTAVDAAGNSASSSVTVSLDRTAPTIRIQQAPLPNDHGWNNSEVQLTFECSDQLSGVSGCEAPLTLTTEGPGTIVAGQATDRAGNAGTTATTVKIDRTSPVVSFTAMPPPNENGWNNSDVSVSFTCSDAGSGIASCPAVVVAATEGRDLSVARTATDRAGNQTTSGPLINLDKTPPVIEGVPSPLPNAAGWNKSRVTVGFDCRDNLSEATECPSPAILDQQGAEQAVLATLKDRAGNVTTRVAAVISIDMTPPTLIVGASRQPDANGCLDGDVVVDFHCADGLAGLVDCPAPIAALRSAGDTIVTASTTDRADNPAVASFLATFNQPPTAIDGGEYPALIPDAVAFGFLLRSLVPLDDSPPEASRVAAILSSCLMELSTARQSVLRTIVAEWAQAHATFAQRAREVRTALGTESDQALAELTTLQEQKDAALTQLVGSMPERLGSEGYFQLLRYVRDSVKPFIEIVNPEPPLACQN